jgi:hypothetical protein
MKSATVIIRYVVLLSYIALLVMAAMAWRQGDDVEVRLPEREMMLEARKSIEGITSLERARDLLGTSLEAHVSLQDAMRAQIHSQRKVMIAALLLGLPALVYVVRATGKNAIGPPKSD